MSRGRPDLGQLVAVLGEAHDLDEPAPFNNHVLDRVADSLGCEYAHYYELDFTTGEFSFHTMDSYEESLGLRPPSRYQGDALARYLGFWDHCQEGVGTWSDIFTRAERRQLYELSPEQRVVECVDMAWMTFGDRRSRSRSCWVVLGQTRDFTHTQRDRFLGSRTFVSSLIRHADARRRLADLMVAVDTDGEGGTSGILLLDSAHHVERASPDAQRIIARWFGRFASELPEALAHWLRSPFPREPLCVERSGERFIVQTPTRGALTVREEHIVLASLTAREREVMSRVADGMSTNEIANALWITPGTVSKHLEHTYRKLGVKGRTAALASLRKTPT